MGVRTGGVRSRLQLRKRPSRYFQTQMNFQTQMTDARLLEVDDVMVRFGGIVALDGVSFDLDQGQILGLIGPNGAGKTTLFNCLSRLYTPASGDIRFEGRSLLGRPAHRI